MDEETEVGTTEVGETAPVEGESASVAAAEPALGTTAVTQPVPPENFFDPSALPPELQPVWKKMQGSFTKKMQALSSERAQASQITEYARRLQSDAEFARAEILKAAPGLGLRITSAGGDGAPGGTSPTASLGAPPSEFIEAIRAELPPELQWMAEGQAKATWRATQALIAPIVERQTADRQTRVEHEYEQLAEQLTARDPTWIEHEQEIVELEKFLSSPALTHPVYGSKLDLLYNVVNKNNAATQEAVRRISGVARNRTVTGRAETATTPNLDEQVRKAPNLQTAFAIAAKAAAEQLKTG